MKIKKLMSREIASVRSDMSLADAARLMWEHDCGFVPVVTDSETLVGVVTDRDICMAAYTQGHALGRIPISVAMAGNVITCREDDDVAAVHAHMRKNQVRRLPVQDRAGKLVGVVSLNDLARKAVAEASSAMRQEVTDTLAEIGKPRQVAVTA